MSKRFTLVAIIPRGSGARVGAALGEFQEGPIRGKRRLVDHILLTLEGLMDEGRPVCIYWDGVTFYTHAWDRRADSQRTPILTFSPLDMGEGRLIVIVSAD